MTFVQADRSGYGLHETTVMPDRNLFGVQSISEVSKYYSLVLLDVGSGDPREHKVYKHKNYVVGPASSKNPDGEEVQFIFTTPPRVHEMTEPFATEITPLQNGGKYVQPVGSILKEVRLQGTTGLRGPQARPTTAPPPRTSEQLVSISQSFRGAEPNRTSVVEKPLNGHDRFHTLKNFFRIYSDLCEYGNTNVIMVWRNVKDGEYWVVEPTQVAWPQNARSPVTYEFNISLRTIMPYTPTLFSGSSDENPAAKKSYQEIMREAARTVTESALLINSYPQEIVRTTLSYVDPVTNVARAASTSAQDIFKGFLLGIKEIEDGTIGASERVALSSINLINMAVQARQEMSASALVGSHIDRVKNAWKRAMQASQRVYCSKAIQSPVPRYRLNRERIRKAYEASPSPGGNPTFVGNVDPVYTLGETYVRPGDTIRGLAERLLGDARNWKDLVLVNELVPPYISPVPAPGVLTFGDKILYPNPQSRVMDNRTPSDQDYNNADSNDESVLNSAYGRDLRLATVEDGLNEYADLVVNERGDIGTITGVPNVHQAIRIKFATEQGDLKTHPAFGARFPIGRKVSVSTFDDFKINARATLQSDPRIEQVTRTDIQTRGDVLTISADMVLLNSKEPVTASFDY